MDEQCRYVQCCMAMKGYPNETVLRNAQNDPALLRLSLVRRRGGEAPRGRQVRRGVQEEHPAGVGRVVRRVVEAAVTHLLLHVHDLAEHAAKEREKVTVSIGYMVN